MTITMGKISMFNFIKHLFRPSIATVSLEIRTAKLEEQQSKILELMVKIARTIEYLIDAKGEEDSNAAALVQELNHLNSLFFNYLKGRKEES